MHQFPRYPALAADFFGNRVRAQTLYQTLPDPGAGAVANKHPTGWNMEKREPVLVNRCTDFGRHSPASVCARGRLDLPRIAGKSPQKPAYETGYFLCADTRHENSFTSSSD
jgi:hypothetical protein